jgi:DNA-binding Xre family transcriptional regulator
VQAIIARNLQVLIQHHYPKAVTATEAHRKLAAAAGTSLSQIQRANSGSAAIGVDTLERLADALSTRVADLVTEGAFAAIKHLPQGDRPSEGEFHRRANR